MASHKSQLPGLPGFDADNLQPWTVRVVVSMTVLALTSVGLRVLSRRLKSQPLWWDDWMVLFSMGWNLVVVGFIFAMYSCGMGIHADLLDSKDIVMMAKWLVVAEVLYAFNLGWTKLGLLLMYYRIFHVPYFKKMAWVVGVFVMAWVVCITFLFIFICVPVQKLWYPLLPGRCIDQVATWIANAASTILTDLIILLMPLPQLWRLRLKKREKIGLTFAFSLGFFVVFASAYRTSVLFTYSTADPSYTLAPTVGWTAIEMSAGIVSTSLPTLLPVLNMVLSLVGIRSKSGTLSTSKGFRSTGDKLNSAPGGPRLVTPAGTENNTFYRLSDDDDRGNSGTSLSARSTPLEAKLRPDTMGGDDIPLHAIRVKTDFEKTIGPK
ncbi:hypothetical protein NLU13_5125 [Sarocladium strictum]|uniref:Rhodopsin domain-containing protein n=1 Tax=Sarocladium strictum TaxID=5046 RepID=A0AA39GK79_SARSR|nr:hypothetical protein NLU13_5125 [Sarocladium strictum]